MKSLVKIGIFAFAFGLFATACNSANNPNSGTEDSIPAVEQEAPMTAPEETAPAADSLSAPADTALSDTAGM